MSLPADNHADPLLAAPASFPATPLLVDEKPPPRATLLDINPTRQHMENLDALRILAMVVIIVTHITQPFLDHQNENVASPVYQAIFSLNVALRFGVPCFMMISFFIYWHQLYDKGRSWGELLARRLKRLVPAFVCWSLIYFVLHKALTGINLNVDKGPLGDRLNWKDWTVWKDMFLLGRAHEHLYYLPVVICSLLLIPLLRVLWKKPAAAWGWVVLTMLGWSVVAYGTSFFPADTMTGRVAQKGLNVSQNVLVLPLLVFPLMGMVFAGQMQWRKFITQTPAAMWVGILIFGVALHVVETLVILPRNWEVALAWPKVGRFLTAVPIFVLILRRPLMKDPFPRVSKHAFGLHFMHPIVIMGLTIVEGKLLGMGPMKLWDAAGQWNVAVLSGVMALNLALTFWITFGLCLLVGRFKRLEFLVV